MLKKGVLILLLCFIASLSDGCSHQASTASETQNIKEASINIKTISVEKVIINPEAYVGKAIHVDGTVKKTDTKLTLRLGCEDDCVSMPVEYDIKPGQAVIIQGKTKKRGDGKFIFIAQRIIQK